MGNKRGMEMIWSTVVYIILALILLTALILIFVFYSGSFLEAIRGYSSKSNLDQQVQFCNQLSIQNSFYEFCCIQRDIKLDKNVKFNMSCTQLTKTDYGKEINGLNCEKVCGKS